jgi:hypothetical protein
MQTTADWGRLTQWYLGIKDAGMGLWGLFWFTELDYESADVRIPDFREKNKIGIFTFKKKKKKKFF